MDQEIYIGTVAKRLAGAKCPHCGRSCEGATSLGLNNQINTPKPGDFSVCLYCGALLCYTESLELRKIERAERRSMKRNPNFAKLVEIAQACARKFRRS